MAVTGSNTRLHRVLPIVLVLLLPFLMGARGGLPKARLWRSVVRCNVTKVEGILSTHVFDRQELGKALWMSVTRAAPDNHGKTLKIVALLLNKGANINFADVYERTALMVASESLDEPLVTLLLSHGADPGLADTKGRRASDYAASAARNAGNVMKLLDYNAQ